MPTNALHPGCSARLCRRSEQRCRWFLFEPPILVSGRVDKSLRLFSDLEPAPVPTPFIITSGSRGFRDGYRGWVLCQLLALYERMIVPKKRELQKRSPN